MTEWPNLQCFGHRLHNANRNDTMALERRKSPDLNHGRGSEPLEAFITELNGSKSRMYDIVEKLKEICKSTQERKDGLAEEAALDAGAFGVGAGILVGLMAAPFTAALSLSATIGAAAVAGGAAAGKAVVNVYQQDRRSDGQTAAEVMKLTSEFVELVQPLRKRLETVKGSFKELHRDTDSVVRTEARVDDAFATIDKLSSETTTERLLVVTEQCEKTLEEMEKLHMKSVHQ